MADTARNTMVRLTIHHLLLLAIQRFSQSLILDVVSTMPKPTHSVFGRDDPERLGHRLDQSFSRARPHFAQNHLDLREGFLYGIQVRRVRWQEHQLRSP